MRPAERGHPSRLTGDPNPTVGDRDPAALASGRSMKDGGQAGRRAEEAVLRHCLARGLISPGRVQELRDAAQAQGKPLLALVARAVPPDALPELRSVHEAALSTDDDAIRPPLLRGDSSEGEATWQGAETALLRGSDERAAADDPSWTGTERLVAPPPFAIALHGGDTVRDATPIPLPASFVERDTVKDLPAVNASGDQGALTERVAVPPALVEALSASVVGAPLARTRADPAPSEAAAQLPVLIGPFPVQAELGRGRTGVVYRAWHAELGRDVAIKVPVDPSESERFLVAARAMARLRHPNIVMVHEVGEAEGRPYIVTDLVQGRSLAELIDAEAPLPPREAAQLARALALALAEGHKRAVLHLALRPKNVRCAGRLEPVLTDFGMITALDLRDVIYVSPEQASAAPDLDRRADVYSLGVILYQLLTGELPYAGDGVVALLAAKRDRDPTRPSKLAHGLDADIEAVCLRCLERAPADRYASAQDVAVDLASWLDGTPIRRAPAMRRLVRWAKRNPVVVLVGAVCLAGLLTVAVALTWVALAR